MTFIDLFSGVGGFRIGMEMAGHKCLGHCEKDKFADKSYRAMHDVREDEWFAEDITKVRASELPRADCWCLGFPCQDISVAGKQIGFDGKRSSLFFTVTKLIRDTREEDKPGTLFIENVKNLFSVNGGIDFLKLLIELDEIGYDAEWQLLNSKNHGVPQNRERVFIVGHLRGRGRREVFPVTESGGLYNQYDKDAKEIHENTLCLTAEGNVNWTGSFINVVGNLNRPQFHESSNRVYGTDGIAPCLNTHQGGGHETKIEIRPVLTPDRAEKRQNGRRFKKDGEPMFTLTGQDRYGVLLAPNNFGHKAGDGTSTRKHYETDVHPALQANCGGTQATYYQNRGRIRRLTPKECFRLQGFSDKYFDKARQVNSDSQLYRQAGNSVTIPVIYAIAKRL